MVKIYRCQIYLIFGLLILTFKVLSQEALVVEGWKYIPQDVDFINRIDTLKAEKNFSQAANEAFKAISNRKKEKTNPLSLIEAKLVLAENLQELGIKGLAVEYFKEIVRENPGTFIAQQALKDLSLLLTNTPFHFDSLRALLNRGAFKEVPKGVDTMIHYFVTLDNMKKKEYKWAQDNLSKIKPENYWGQQIEYLKALELVKNGELKKAQDALEELESLDSTHPVLKQNIGLQRARIFFELKDYDGAEKQYLKYDFKGRESGRILFERALVSYYQKKYAFALGLLESLKSENFKTAFNPDQVILEMMIYRDVCHYPTVKKIALEFDKKYSFLINYLKSLNDLSKSQILKRIIFQNEKFKNSADLVNAYRNEGRDLRNNSFNLDKSLVKKLLSDLKKYETKLVIDVDNEIQPYLKKVANDFFSKSEEIRLLDYVSSLDEFRIKTLFESRNYRSEDSSKSSDYSQLYWPVQKEYWADEYKNYQVLLVDRCDGTLLNKRGNK